MPAHIQPLVSCTNEKKPNTCGSCQHLGLGVQAAGGAYVERPECRRRSPTTDGWPRVKFTDGCGEYVLHADLAVTRIPTREAPWAALLTGLKPRTTGAKK